MSQSRVLELEALAQDFSNWRRSKAYRGSKTPAHLKARALDLSPYFTKTDFYRALGICSSTLSQWRQEKEKDNDPQTSQISLPYSRVDVSLQNATLPAVYPKDVVLPLANLKCGGFSIDIFTTTALVAVCQTLAVGGEK